MPIEFPEGKIRLTKLKSPIYTLPSGPEARATGAKSLLLSARPLQLEQETLLWCPLPITVEMTGGCWEMNMFSPLPLCTIPEGGENREKKQKAFKLFCCFRLCSPLENQITKTATNIGSSKDCHQVPLIPSNFVQSQASPSPFCRLVVSGYFKSQHHEENSWLVNALTNWLLIAALSDFLGITTLIFILFINFY